MMVEGRGDTAVSRRRLAALRSALAPTPITPPAAHGPLNATSGGQQAGALRELPRRRMICNDDGWLTSDPNDPTGLETMSAERIQRGMVDSYRGSPVDVVSWCVGSSESYQYETKVGERVGAAYRAAGLSAEALAAAANSRIPSLDSSTNQQLPAEEMRALRALTTLAGIEQMESHSAGPLQEMVARFQVAGITCIPGIRMNSHYEVRSSGTAALAVVRDRHLLN